MRIVVDTSVLVRILDSASKQHGSSVEALSELVRQGCELCLVPQNLYEFWVVITRKVDANGLGLSVVKAKDELHQLESLFTVLRDERQILERWLSLVTRFKISGTSAHDARIAAAMDRHSISSILTLDPKVFRRIPHIDVFTPEDVLSDVPHG